MEDYKLLDGYTKEVEVATRSLYVVKSLLSINCDRDLTKEEETRLDYHANRIKLFDLTTQQQYTEEDFQRAIALNHNAHKRYNRLYNYIFDMVNSFPDRAYFLTLTFKDAILQNYNYKDAKDLKKIYRIVQIFLKENCNFYIANIDFGTKDKYVDNKGIERIGTHRLHFHAVVIPKTKIDLKKWQSLYGGINIKKVCVNMEDAKRLGKYITKLTNHSIKESTQKNRCIYSRHLNVLRAYRIGLELFGDILKIEGVDIT